MELWARNCPVILPKFRLPRKFRDLLHAANLLHGTDGFTSPPKEGVLRIFFALKIRRLRPGLNPRTWVLKASTLPLDHRSRYTYIHTYIHACIYTYVHTYIHSFSMKVTVASCNLTNAFKSPTSTIWLGTERFASVSRKSGISFHVIKYCISR